MTDRRERPKVLLGLTQRIETGYGKLYVEINVETEEDEKVDPDMLTESDPFELFANIGNSGGFTNGFVEGIGKTFSNGLRSAKNPRSMAYHTAMDLTGIQSGKVGVDNGDDIYSIPDGVGIAVLRFLSGSIGQSIRDNETGEIKEDVLEDLP